MNLPQKSWQARKKSPASGTGAETHTVTDRGIPTLVHNGRHRVIPILVQNGRDRGGTHTRRF